MGFSYRYGLGLDKQRKVILSPFDKLINSFGSRVTSDGGITESLNCIKQTLTAEQVKNATLVIPPNGYDAGTLYALKPTDGSGDVTWVRNGEKTRINKDKQIELLAANTPSLDFSNGNCPVISVEEQATNLVESNYTAPYSNNVIGSAEIFHFQDSPFSESIPNAVSEGVKSTNPSGRYEYVFSENQLQQGQTYTFSWYTKRLEEPILDRVGNFRIFNHVNIEAEEGGQVQIESDINGFDRFQINFTVIDETLESRLRAYYSTINGVDGVVRILYGGMQIEEGENATSVILTDGSAVTRPSDAPQQIAVPTGTTEIEEIFEDGTSNVITTIPTSYEIPFGRFKAIIFRDGN